MEEAPMAFCCNLMLDPSLEVMRMRYLLLAARFRCDKDIQHGKRGTGRADVFIRGKIAEESSVFSLHRWNLQSVLSLRT